VVRADYMTGESVPFSAALTGVACAAAAFRDILQMSASMLFGRKRRRI